MIQDEEQFLNDWRRQGPLGTLIDVINYIRTPQQHEIFRNFQCIANRELPGDTQRLLEPVKPVVTRWNSFCSAFERAVKLQPTFNKYINYHVESQRDADSYARSHNNQKPNAPRWMRSGGLTAHDWAVINEYIDVLQPLKEATKRLEGRGNSGRFGAIYEVLPVFEYLLHEFEQRSRPYEVVDYELPGAPEDHVAINVKAAWMKINEYYQKLDESPVYYAACCLHPYYRSYCERAWRYKPDWLAASNRAFQSLWASYQAPRSPKARRRERNSSAIDDAIAAIVDDDSYSDDDEGLDEYTKWRASEPKWKKAIFESPGSNPVKYWVALRHKYPNLARFAIDLLTIPASSCDCERMFSELGDLLTPRRRNISPQLLAALQCIRAWRSAGLAVATPVSSDQLSDNELDKLYEITSWEQYNDA